MVVWLKCFININTLLGIRLVPKPHKINNKILLSSTMLPPSASAVITLRMAAHYSGNLLGKNLLPPILIHINQVNFADSTFYVLTFNSFTVYTPNLTCL